MTVVLGSVSVIKLPVGKRGKNRILPKHLIEIADGRVV